MSTENLRASSRWTFFAALIVAPWAYGGTTATSIVVINWVIAAALLFWVLGLIVGRTRLKFPGLLLFVIAALLLIGAWMTFNARSVYDPEFGAFAGIQNFASRGPGSLDYALSFAWMIRAILLLGVILLVVDLVRDEKALLQLWAVLAISGGSIALLGLLQKATGAKAIFWQMPIGGYAENFFGSYYYHGNAGAFLNVALPFTAGFAVRVFGKPASQGVRVLWLTIFLLNVAALAANTSRMAQLIAGLIVIVLLIRFGSRVVRGLTRSEKNVVLAGAAAVLFVMYAIGTTSHLERPLKRWEQLTERVPEDARWAVSRIALNTAPQVGLFGFGPGTFRSVFPAFVKTAEHPVAGQWRFLHQDYLQTMMEWGWAGSALWAALFLGGIAVAIRSLIQQRRIRRGAESSTRGRVRSPEEVWSWRRRVILQMSILALAGVALHALVDFPLQIESIQLYVATCLGICWGSVRWSAR